MTDTRHTAKARILPSVRLGGTSLLALMVAGLGAQPAWGQATPGSPPCPVVGNVVTCSGALPDGVAVTSGAYQGLTVSGVSGDMAATNRPVIGFRSDAPATTIALDDPDSVVRLTAAAGPTAPNLVGAIQAIVPDNTAFSLTSNLDIVVTEQTGGTVQTQPAGIVVAGEGGTYNIVNSGDIAIRNVDFAPDSAFMFIDTFGADLVSVRNSGDFTPTDSDVHSGIIVAADNKRVEIVNEGDILNPDGPNGIALRYQISRFAAPVGGLRQVTPSTGVGGQPSYFPAPTRPLESYSIRNSGLIATDSFGIRVTTTQVDRTGNGSGDLGAPDGTIVNDGTIRSIFGIAVSHYGDRSIVNNGRLENIGDDEFFGISVSPGNDLPDYVPATVNIENSAAGVIEYDGTFIAWGIEHRNNPATIRNAGRISLTGGEGNRGIEVTGFGQFLGLTRIENSGTIQVAGGPGWGVRTVFGANPTGAFSDTQLVNSGLIEATGAGSRALEFNHRDFGTAPGGAQRGQVSLDLAATSVVRGGSGAEGAAIAFVGGESHSILNRGLVSAASGRAIVGGAAGEALDSSGRIEGSVTLAEGNDSVTLRAGAVQIGTLDGGANTDALLFDIASGNASATGAILNFESVRKTGAGTLTLRDTGTIGLGLSFEGGTLLAEGSLGATAISAPAGTTFGGSGSVGAVTMADGSTISPGGTGIGTLTAASLSLAGNSRLLFDLGAPGSVGGTANDLISVTGNLVLDGLLDIAARPDFGTGVYRLIDYGGALTDNGLAVGNAPAQDYAVQTGVAGQVNLVVSAAGPGPTPPIQFWDGSDTAPDGTIDGGSGTWSAAASNWTRANGQVNEAWNGNFAVFQGAAGTVTVEPAGIAADGLQFAVTGYRIEGGPLRLDAPATVRVGDGSAGGSAYSATIASAIGGAGGLAKTDLGTLVLAGANSYTGGTAISGGVLQIAAESGLGASSGALTLDGGTLRTSAALTLARTLVAGAGGGTLDTQANAVTLSGPVQGTGALGKAGSGTLTLSGASSGYTGRMTLAAGALRLDGALGGTLEIGAGTTLSGTGTLGSLTLAGTLSPGTSIGTLTATGNAVFRPSSVFSVELAAAGGTDRLNVAGTAAIEGGTVAVAALDPDLNYTDGSTYTFLNAAGGRTGTFAGLSESSAFLDFTLGYTASSAFITVDVIRTFPEVAGTFNQAQAATGLRDLARTAGSDSLAAYNAILLLGGPSARAAFDASSGEIYPVVMAAALRRAEMAGARLAGRGWDSAGRGLVLWGGAEGHDGSSDGDGNGAAYSFDGRGLNLGLDYRGAGFAVGVGGGWTKSDVDLPGRASSARSDGWHLGVHASAGSGNSGFSAAASAVRAEGDADIARSIGFGTVARAAGAEVDTTTTALSADVRYGVALGGGWSAGPVLSASWSKVTLGAFGEAGAGALALSGTGSSADWSGYAAGAFFNLAGARGRIDASVQYLHRDGRTIEADGLSFAGAAGRPFRVRAAAAGDDAALVRLGGQYELGGGWSVGGNVRAVRGGGEKAVSGAATLAWKF